MIAQYPVRTIDLRVLRENVRWIRSALPDGTLLMAVVKADAYGHGIVRVARNALHAGADWLAVARTDEGAALRKAGIRAPILVLGAATRLEIEDGVQHDLTLAVADPKMISVISTCAAAHGKIGLIHLKLDTGMGRIGLRSREEVCTALAELKLAPNVRLTGVFTHFADADGCSEHYTRLQLSRFLELCELLPAGIIRHCANSAAIHRYPEAALDMVRAGISMYGYPAVRTDMPLKPVMDWRTAVTCVKPIQAGDKISYGCTFTAPKPMMLATVACGYGDGYHRSGSGKAHVIINGKRCPIVGRICMDQMMADVTGLDTEAGDEVILLGESQGEKISAEELGAWSGTISYEVLLAATDRVYRRWINDCDE